ncbi:MAG: hypothetical protein M3462_08000 [Chloroflexota bacterium]|nr:hypothetical protein [Chloroflexota bacterium]
MTTDADGGAPGAGETGSGDAEPGTVNDANTVPVIGGGEGDTPDAGAVSAELPETVVKASATKTPTLAREVLASDAGDVRATTVSMERSGADSVTAERVIMSRSGTQRLDARSAQLDRSGVVRAQVEHMVMHAGSAVVVVATEARLVKTKAILVVSRSTTLEDSTRVLVHIGPETTCTTPLLGTKGAASFGAAFAVVLFLLRTLTRRGR